MSGLPQHERQVVLDAIQCGFPLTHDPYGALAGQLGLPRAHVVKAVDLLREDGTIRRIGASFSSKRLGFSTTLCALAVPGDEAAVDEAAKKVSAHSQVTHNYLRDDRYNIWFTVIAPSWDDVTRVLDQVRAETGCDDALNLPATMLYKVSVNFSSGRQCMAKGRRGKGSQTVSSPETRPFSADDPFDVQLVRWAQGDIAGEHPFALPGLDEKRVLRRLREWQCDGTIRRFGAFVRHRQMGYAFNGMTVWDVRSDDAGRLGRAFAELDFVSHCYERLRAATWPYNLYAMVHAKTRDQLDGYVGQMRALAGCDCRVLVSSKEYKKTSPIYFD